MPRPSSESATLEVASATLADCVAALPGATCLPVTHEGQLLAVLASTLPARVAMPSSETALLRDLAGHAGLLVANARLTTELAREVDLVTRQASELLRSRQRVVAAQDAERERLERDIHDGAQQELVATLIQLRAEARTGGGADTSGAARHDSCGRWRETARTTIEELCRGGGPMMLAEGGLAVGARRRRGNGTARRARSGGRLRSRSPAARRRGGGDLFLLPRGPAEHRQTRPRQPGHRPGPGGGGRGDAPGPGRRSRLRPGSQPARARVCATSVRGSRQSAAPSWSSRRRTPAP